MADIELVIKIPEEIYKECQRDAYFINICEKIFDAVKEGIPLKDAMAMELAIKALKAEPCEDCISRNTLLEYFLRPYSNEETYSNLEIEKIIRGMPTVTPQSKTGHWIEENINEWSRKVFCSECGCPSPFEHISNGDIYSASGYGIINKTKFCPNCGAKMVELQEKRCENCNHYGKFSLDCGRCDDNCSMYEPQKSEEQGMSDFDIVSKNAKVDMCYGLETFHITREEIAALVSGKKLYSTVNCGEYAITIEMAEGEEE